MMERETCEVSSGRVPNSAVTRKSSGSRQQGTMGIADCRRPHCFSIDWIGSPGGDAKAATQMGKLREPSMLGSRSSCAIGVAAAAFARSASGVC